MAKEMVISTSSHETKVALREEDQLVEVYLEREKDVGLVGSVYKGRVTRVLPGMQSAFVDIGLERDAFLYVSDYFEEIEELAESEPVLPLVGPEVLTSEEEPEAPPPSEAGPPAVLDLGQPSPGQPAPPERQPEPLSAEPPLRLPETRPLGRGRPRRHRGGRGRHGRGRGPLPDRPQPRRWDRERPAAESYQPVILPGESLAKYRDRIPTAAPEPTPPAPAALPPEEFPALPSRIEPGQETIAPPVEPPAPFPEATTADTEPQVEEVEEEYIPAPASFEAPEAEPLSGREELPAEPELPEGPPRLAKAGEGPVPEAEPIEPPSENGIEATTLAEIERVRRSEDQVGLPPSVRERTAGGVEWARPSRTGRHPPYRRGRGRGPVRGRGREEQRRGGRPRLPARPSRGQPAIAELLRAGQEIIVQIAKEQMGKKGARITSHITLPGRFLVYMPTIDHIGVSRKIGTAEERSRLRRLLLELKGSSTGGFVVRTAATGCSEEALRQDIDYLIKLWHELRTRAEELKAPALLHRDLSLTERLLRDQLTEEYESVWIDSEEEYAQVVEFVARFQSALVPRVKLYTKQTPIFEEMGVQQEIERALRPKVWLKSGGYIVINHTEALVAIDVNTGKYVGKGSTRLEDTIVKTNLEAVQEVVRQIRLRDLGGIIIIDFIDMEDPRNRQRVMRALEDALRADRSPSKVLGFNEFGLVAVTRKRSRQSLEKVLCQPCPYCTGTGMVKSLATLCYEIQGEVRKMAGVIDAPELTIRAHPEIVKALKGRDHALVRELEEQTGKNIILQAETTLHFDQYNIY